MGRNGTLDSARLIAAFGIVVFHAGAPGGSIGYAALPFFLILLVVLAAPGARAQAFAPYARTRAQRLLGPWLVWSAVYGALKLAELTLTGAPLSSEFTPWMALTGPALHLWFLPFAFAACLLVHPLARLQASLQADAPDTRATAAAAGQPTGQTTGQPPLPAGVSRAMRRGAVPLALLAAALAVLALRQGHSFPVPFAQWLYALPAVFLGLALALTRGRMLWILALPGLLAGAALLAGWTSGLVQLVLAAAALAVCMALPRPGTALSRHAGDAALGVYLAHPLVLSVLGRITDLAEGSLTLAATACLLSLAIALAVSAAPGWRAALPRRTVPRGAAPTGYASGYSNGMSGALLDRRT